MENQLSLFSEKTMTTKELAELFNCDERTIQINIKELFPEIVKNGIKTLLNEKQVTILKLKMEKNYSLENVFELPSTDLEMLLLQKKLDKWKDDKIRLLSEENQLLKVKNIELKPKAEIYDNFIEINDNHDMKDVAKIINYKNIGRNKLFNILRIEKILMSDNTPYQNYVNIGYFVVKIKVNKVAGNNFPVTFATPKGIEFIKNILKKY